MIIPYTLHNKYIIFPYARLNMTCNIIKKHTIHYKKNRKASDYDEEKNN